MAWRANSPARIRSDDDAKDDDGVDIEADLCLNEDEVTAALLLLLFPPPPPRCELESTDPRLIIITD